MKEYLHTIFRSLCVVALLCGSMSAWADDEAQAPTFITNLKSEYFCTTDEGIGLFVDVSDHSATLTWYESKDEAIDDQDEEITIDEEYESYDFVYSPTSDTYVYCVATNSAGSTTSTVAKINAFESLSSWEDFGFKNSTDEGFEDYYVIADNHDWNAFIYGYENYFDGASFILNSDITTTTVPTSPISSSDYPIEFNGHKISYTVPCPNQDHSALFFYGEDEDDEAEANVKYTYTIENEVDLDNFLDYFISDEYPENVSFKLLNDIEWTSDISSLSNVTSFDSNGYKIKYTATLPGDPDSHSALFFNDPDTDAAAVEYTYNIMSSTELGYLTAWSNNTFSNVKIVLAEDVTFLVADIPENPYTAPSNFSFGTKDDGTSYAVKCNSSGSIKVLNHVFGDADLQKKVICIYSISTGAENYWDKFVENYKAISENCTPNYNLVGDNSFTVSTLDKIDETITPDNFHINDGNYITFNLSELQKDEEGNLIALSAVFTNETLQQHVKYNYNICDDTSTQTDAIKWSDFVSYSKSGCVGELDHFTIVAPILLATAPSTTSLVPSVITSSNIALKDTEYGVYIVNNKNTNETYDGAVDCPLDPVTVFADTDLDEKIAHYCYKISEAKQLFVFAKTKFLQKDHSVIFIIGEFVSKNTDNSTSGICGDKTYKTSSGKEYDIHEELFDYPLGESCTVYVIGEDGNYEEDGKIAAAKIVLPYNGTPSIYVNGPYDLLFTKTPINGAINYWWQTGAAASKDPIEPITDPIAKQLLYAMYEKVAGTLHILTGKTLNVDEGGAGAGTQADPYRIMNYNALNAFITYINNNSVETDTMYVKLLFDVHAQGWSRLTDVDGKEIVSPTESAQFTTFKGHFDGNNHTIGGLTRPLFASLDGATVENLGLVDCNMSGNSALAVSASDATVTHCYVSGVSNGLAPSGATMSNCYAYNTSTKETTTSDNFSSTTTSDLSGTHNIFSDFCYTLHENGTTGTAVYSDGTLFTPTDNTMYYFDSPSEYVESEGDTPTNISATCNNWYNSLDWSLLEPILYNKGAAGADGWTCNVDNPTVDNVALLHNVYTYGCRSLNSTNQRSLYNLYSWYIVDRNDLATNSYSTMCRIKNIYYTGRSYDGLNTICMPFPWNPEKDIYEVGSDSPIGTGVKVYILADKIDDNDKFVNYSDNVSYYDYSSANKLNFVCPSNSSFESVSNFLPAIVSIPSGKTKWCIKRHFNIWAPYSSDQKMSSNDVYHNLYYDVEVNSNVQYWSQHSNYDNRSFMEIGSLSELHEYENGRALHCGATTTVAAGTFGSYGSYTAKFQGMSYNFTCYKLNSAGTGFARATSGSSVLPFRTFIAIYSSSSNAKSSFGFGFVDVASEDTPTSIDGVPTEGIELMNAEQSKVYSVDGRYVGQYGKKLAPGIYIMNGKKIAIK